MAGRMPQYGCRQLWEKGWSGFVTALKGMTVTIRYFFSRPITVVYPYEKLELPVYYRGRHRQRADENGIPWCIACNACSRACPLDCITIEASKNPDPPDSKRKRKLDRFDIDLARCMYCGLCDEACPQDCLMLVADYEYSAWSVDDLMMPLEIQLRPEPISEAELKYQADPTSDPARPKPKEPKPEAEEGKEAEA
jgi:NADH-quinone oxidoreductase chain I